MVGIYDVWDGQRKAGTVQVEQQGLYYHFFCRCSTERPEMLRLWMGQGNREVDLGLCVPVDGGIGTEKRIPVKQCGQGVPCFFLRSQSIRKKFIPLSPEEPFRYIHRLGNAYLEQRGNLVGIVISQSVSDL